MIWGALGRVESNENKEVPYDLAHRDCHTFFNEGNHGDNYLLDSSLGKPLILFVVLCGYLGRHAILSLEDLVERKG